MEKIATFHFHPVCSQYQVCHSPIWHWEQIRWLSIMLITLVSLYHISKSFHKVLLQLLQSSQALKLVHLLLLRTYFPCNIWRRNTQRSESQRRWGSQLWAWRRHRRCPWCSHCHCPAHPRDRIPGLRNVLFSIEIKMQYITGFAGLLFHHLIFSFSSTYNFCSSKILHKIMIKTLL